MALTTPRVVLDANVLYPAMLRDTLLRAAEQGRFHPFWTADILEETTRNLVNKAGISPQQADQLRCAMTAAFPNACITGYEALITEMPNHAGDRHVAAGAVTADASLIVTLNLKHFDPVPVPLRACSPDEFLDQLFTADPAGMTELVHRQAASLRTPPRSLEQVLDILARSAPQFAASVRRHVPSA